MNERGSALVEALIVTLSAGVIGAAALRVIADLPPQAAKWEEAASARQRVRTIQTRVGRIAAGAGPIDLEVDGNPVRIPSIWPRRLGLFRPSVSGDVSSVDVTLLSRIDSHRMLVLASALGAAGPPVAVTPQPGCGSAPMCGVRTGDLVLAVSRAGECGLFRVEAVSERLDVNAIMQAGRASFEPGSVLVPIRIDVISFDRDEGTLRHYDGYRSDNVMIDGLRAVSFTFASQTAPALGDGPFIGSGPLAYDVDQVSLTGIGMRFSLVDVAAFPSGALLEWRIRGWP